MKQIMLRYIVGVMAVSFMVILTPFVSSIIRDQDSVIVQTLIVAFFVSVCAMICGLAIGLMFYETKSDETK